ncbi:YqhG family protein [Gracilibacillus sp. JCM 18860]|uniref:YqhG family protein n=1 Tax=Gracilibacillus sp. JCM 18860 TaxID=1306159 RepID=UPI0006D1EDDE
MKLTNLHQFLYDFFTIQDCAIREETEHTLEVQLTRELDQALMNRPFYWHYMDKMGQQGVPMSLSLNTSPEKLDDQKEWIHFGSPRLQQIFSYIQDKARITLLYEQTDGEMKTSLLPWLVVNVKMEYFGKQKKDHIQSIGLQLINGTMLTNMMLKLDSLPLQRVMSDYSYTISPLIKPSSGFYRIFQYFEEKLSNEDMYWASDAQKALEDERKLLEHFFSKNDDLSDLYEQELYRVKERLEPKISLKVINAGLFYLSENTNASIISQ